MAWEKNTAQTVMVTFYAAGEPTAPTGALTATISQDGAGFGAIAGSVAQVAGTPCALLTLAAADVNCDTGVVKIVDAGGAADDRYIEFVTEANYTAARAVSVDAILADTGTDGVVVATSSKTGYALSTAGIDAILDEEVNSATATANSLRGAAKAAWAQGFGKWTIAGTTLTLYGTDGTTAVRTFTLDDANAPNSRTPA